MEKYETGGVKTADTGKLMDAKGIIKSNIAGVLGKLYGTEIDDSMIQIYKTRRDFDGDYTLFAFPFAKISKQSAELTAEEIGTALAESLDIVDSINIVKGFVNIKMRPEFWAERLQINLRDANFGQAAASGKRIMVEYSSPNTNKPLHLGHIRNNLLGGSVARILEACGHEIIKVNLVNDRGIHICKSMVAWKKFGAGETPQSSGKKGDHLVGDYYVRFDREYKAEMKTLIDGGQTEAEAANNAPIFAEAREMLRKWEARDEETIALWQKMNGWVYEGFDETYRKLGVAFDRIYYESDTWILGKKIVEEGLAKGILFRNEDSSVWIDLTAEGLDRKVLLRSDGTTVYMTQDLGTAEQRFDEYGFDKLIYVVGNEQNYHFQALKLILKKLGHDWADSIYHLSYGMVELPEGKMKSREGTVVDADDLIAEMQKTAREVSEELGKLNEMSAAEANKTVDMIALGALKYYILKVDPKKTMLFDPKESIDFNGNTASFIQYTHARICSVLRKHGSTDFLDAKSFALPGRKETELIKLVELFPETVRMAGENLSPALVANCVYDLSKEYNQFYHDFPILKEEDADTKNLRLALSFQVAETIRKGMGLLGIDVPEKM